jgi:transcriptional regulator with XRE-family HTH domain
VGGLLVQLRKEAALNQTALAARLGITQSEVSKYERGERCLDERRLAAWLRVLAHADRAAT